MGFIIAVLVALIIGMVTVYANGGPSKFMKAMSGDTSDDDSGEPKLIPCPSCKKEISPLASSCPNCGRPTEHGVQIIKDAKRSRRGNVQGVGCLTLLIALVFILISPVVSYLLFPIGIVIILVGLFI